MRLLLDTHAFFWFIAGAPDLSRKARDHIEDERNQKLPSMASIWEMAIKVSIGRLILSEPFETLISRQIEINGFELLSIKFDHASRVA